MLRTRNQAKMTVWAAAVLLVGWSAFGLGPNGPTTRPGRGESGGRGDRARPRKTEPHGGRDSARSDPRTSEEFHDEVPEHPHDIILANPTPTSITVSILCRSVVDGYVEYGLTQGDYPKRTPAEEFKADVPTNVILEDLTSGAEYHYRWRYRPRASGGKRDQTESPYLAGPPHRFQLPRPAGRPFSFTIQADSLLDANMSPEVYVQTLANALADRPDFHVDLGDTFMVDKRREFHDALPQYLAQRYYFGQVCHSAPLFMVLGNHDGEYGYAASGPDSIAAWSFSNRTRFFPPPLVPEGKSGMYSGRTSLCGEEGAHHYAFTWGDAEFIVLDPFWPTRSRIRGGRGPEGSAVAATTDANWSRTLGREQYDWLEHTLVTSPARFKFVFIHHLVGGFGKDARGGMEASGYFEWGGKNADGSPGFRTHRPGWPMPIHDLLVKQGVTAVFHGHDHLYVHAERDGLTYQCVPQPGNPRAGTRSAADYGYQAGEILSSPGHIRVTVERDRASVEFIRAAAAHDRSTPHGRREMETNGTVAAKYDLQPTPATRTRMVD